MQIYGISGKIPAVPESVLGQDRKELFFCRKMLKRGSLWDCHCDWGWTNAPNISRGIAPHWYGINLRSVFPCLFLLSGSNLLQEKALTRGPTPHCCPSDIHLY